MSEAQDRDNAAAGTEGDVAEGNGSGGSLFKRLSSGEPQDQGVRRWAYAVGGALAALVVTGLGVRRWRRRG